MTERFTALLSRNKSTEQERHELAVIDAAVRGAGTDQPEDAALTDFALRISAARAIPNDGFYRELDEKFGVTDAEAGAGKQRSRRRRAPLFATGAGALASVLVAVVLVASMQSSGGDQSGVASMPSSSGGDTSLGVTEAEPGMAPDAAPEKAIGKVTEDVAVGSPRKVASDADLLLATGEDNVESVADGVIRITDQYDGYVGNSSVTGGDQTQSRASFDLKFPAEQFQSALAELSQLAHVRSRTQNTEDITAPFSRSRARLTIARAQRDRLAAKYAAAVPGSREAAALKVRLSRAERRVDSRRESLARLQNRASFAGISLGVVGDDSVAGEQNGPIARGIDTAVSLLTSIAAILIVALAVAIPAILIGGAAWLTVRRARRRRSDRLLDAAAAGSGTR